MEEAEETKEGRMPEIRYEICTPKRIMSAHPKLNYEHCISFGGCEQESKFDFSLLSLILLLI